MTSFSGRSLKHSLRDFSRCLGRSSELGRGWAVRGCFAGISEGARAD